MLTDDDRAGLARLSALAVQAMRERRRSVKDANPAERTALMALRERLVAAGVPLETADWTVTRWMLLHRTRSVEQCLQDELAEPTVRERRRSLPAGARVPVAFPVREQEPDEACADGVRTRSCPSCGYRRPATTGPVRHLCRDSGEPVFVDWPS